MSQVHPTPNFRIARMAVAIFCGVTMVALLVIGFVATLDPNAPRPTICQRAEGVPAYSVLYEDGSRVDVPNGRAQLRDAEPDTPRGTTCAAILGQWDHDQTYEGYRPK